MNNNGAPTIQEKEDMKAWCPSSSQNVGRMIEIRGSDEWRIECPVCGTWWSGGSTLLADHKKPGCR